MNTLLDRFLRYVRVDTKADENSTTYPSSPGQLASASCSATSYSRSASPTPARTNSASSSPPFPATCPAHRPSPSTRTSTPTPRTRARTSNPQIIRNYVGGDIVLPKDPTKVIRVAENPELNAVIGKTVITTDGTTLLGADDKAGLAVIMEMARILVENPADSARTGEDRLHLRRGDRQRGAAPGTGATRRRGRVHARRHGVRRNRGRDVLRGCRQGDDLRREHPSVDRQGADDQRDSPGGHVSRPFAEADAQPRDHRRTARVHASDDDRRRRCRGEHQLHPARFRHGEASRRGGDSSRDRPTNRTRIPRSESARRDAEAVSEHARRHRQGAAGREVRRSRDAASRAGTEVQDHPRRHRRRSTH